MPEDEFDDSVTDSDDVSCSLVGESEVRRASSEDGVVVRRRLESSYVGIIRFIGGF